MINAVNKYVIVTGGAGYIGSHACKALRNAGYRPITVDNLSTGWADAVKFGPLERVDLLDRDKLNQVFKKYQPYAVMHFAAFSQVPLQSPSVLLERLSCFLFLAHKSQSGFRELI